jgi:hypothetical protein
MWVGLHCTFESRCSGLPQRAGDAAITAGAEPSTESAVVPCICSRGWGYAVDSFERRGRDVTHCQYRTDRKRGLALELVQGTHHQPTYHEE